MIPLVDWGQELVLLLPLPLIVLANLAQAHPDLPAMRRAGAAAIYAAPALVMLVGLGDVAAALQPGSGRAAIAVQGAGLVVGALAAIGAQLDPWLGRLARMMPLDPRSPVHRLALVLTVLIVLTQLSTQLTTDVLAAQAARGTPLTRIDLVAQELPFVAAAVLGVGLLIRRGPRATAVRLGLVRPAAREVVVAVAAAGLFYAFGIGMDHLAQLLTPGLARKVQAATDRLFSGLSDPVGIVTIAVAAGLCEELLFRGALQPRLGLLWVAIVFTSVHTQYGLSVDTAAVLVLACGLGLVRRYANTTAAIICHVTYNGLVGASLDRVGIPLAVAAEAGLVALAVLGYGLAFRRRPVAQSP